MVSVRSLTRRSLIGAVGAALAVGVYETVRHPDLLSDHAHALGAAGAARATPNGAHAGARPDRAAMAAQVERLLPRGGRRVFPTYRLVGFSGNPGSPAFGRLGIGNIDQRVAEIERLGEHYRAGRLPLPVLELIAVVAQTSPGPDGRYRARVDQGVIQSYLDAARRHRALLLLNIQPGRARFMDEVRALQRWLEQPDVGLALDPEWAVGPGQVPGQVFGHSSGAQVDEVARYLAQLVAAHNLPEKVLVVHQLSYAIIPDWSGLRAHPGVVVIKSVDGIGGPQAKVDTWKVLVTRLPATLHPGFKLFFEEDVASGGRLMTAAEVLALKPTPEYILYE